MDDYDDEFNTIDSATLGEFAYLYHTNIEPASFYCSKCKKEVIILRGPSEHQH